VYQPDAFLTYMSGSTARLVANDAGVVAPNSLHILRLYPGSGLASDELAATWQTSLSRLSVEIEGHALGGGMLKVEPTEAERIVLPFLPDRRLHLSELSMDLDALIRGGNETAAAERADAIILRNGIGLSKSDCRLLRTAADGLRDRRCSRGTAQ
jgi:hypothetical protein